MGKEGAILEALGRLPGVHLTEETYLHSNGILGLICAGVEDPEAVLDKVAGMTSEIESRIARGPSCSPPALSCGRASSRTPTPPT